MSAVCNADTTFDATVSVDIPKPKGFFSGTPKPSPEVISEGITKAKQDVLQQFISKCVTERNKLDQYLKVKQSIELQTDSFVNVTKSKQDQKDLKLNVKVRATVNDKLLNPFYIAVITQQVVLIQVKSVKEWFHFL